MQILLYCCVHRRLMFVELSIFLNTGQSFISFFNPFNWSVVRFDGVKILITKVSIFLGPSLDICLWTSSFRPSNDHLSFFALIPITVSRQVPNAVATRSVGQKSRPFPSWSRGASVRKTEPDCWWRDSVFKSPRYVQIILFTLHTSYRLSWLGVEQIHLAKTLL